MGCFGSAGCVLAAPTRELASAGLSREQIDAVREAREGLDALPTRLAALADEGVRVLSCADPDYPEMLAIPSRPPVISILGEAPGGGEASVAIVGTRACTPDGFEFARDLARELAGCGAWIVSGLALGIDTAAHLGALDANGRTLAVIGSGIDVVYPRENRQLAAQIAESGGLLSELPPGTRPNVARLMARNRLQSAMSNAVVVVEAHARGGSLVTAGYARKQGRLLFACDWPDEKEEAIGTRRLIAQGAMRVASPSHAEKVLDAIRQWNPPDEAAESAQAGLFP